MKQICPICGRSDVTILPNSNICVNCYNPEIKIKEKLDIYVCPSCDKYLYGKWKTLNEIAFKKFLKNKLKLKNGNIEEFDLNNKFITVSMTLNDVKFKTTRKVNFNLKKLLCSDCSRKSSGYYEAIIQLRGNNKLKLEKKFNKITSGLEKMTFISKIIKLKNNAGYDIYVGNKQKVFELLNKLELRFKTTRKIAGRIDGNDVYRTTFLVRFD
ncbi:MAG: 60S ribosomal export protein NMD3 [Candidatus Micrarchaeota archaeon]|nr:60S ribosomal export protein NMD3 [Candidatus Micrarchaeota archaeon]